MKTDYLKKVWWMVACVAAFYPAADAAVVPGTPADNFLRSHSQQSPAPEGIVYQVPDDKLEPGKLYHDTSQDKSRMVTRKRVVGSLNQTSAQDSEQSKLGNLKYDVTFHYASSRASNGKGVLTWSVNRLDVDVDEALIQSRMQGLAKISSDLYQKAVEYEIERTVAHENQHVMDATNNPVWLYAISNGQDGNPNSLMNKSDRAMLESLDSKLAEDLDNQRLELIAMAEARAVFASVRQATYQLVPLLDMDKETLSETRKAQYVPGLYEGLFERNGESEELVKEESEELVKERRAESTYDKVLDKLKSDRDLFELAQEEVLYGSSAKIEIDKKKTRYSYKDAYNLYYNSALASAGSAYNEYSSLSDSVGEEMENKMAEYKKNIEKMYELIHAKLYEENAGLQGLKDERRVKPEGGSASRSHLGQMSCLEWLTAVLNELNGEQRDKELAELAVTMVHDLKYTDEETEKLRAGIFRAIGKLVQTGCFYDNPGTDKEKLIDAIICTDCLAGLKLRVSGTRPFRISRVKQTAYELFHSKELTIEHPDAQKAYKQKFEKEYFSKPRRWKSFADYDYAMYRDKILKYCKEIYDKEANDIEKEAEESTERYKMLFRPANKSTRF